MSQIEIELKKLILDEDFTNILDLVNEEVNLMSILKVDHKELQHSNLISWLFDPTETHNLGDLFIKEFIKLFYRQNNYSDLGNTEAKMSVFDFMNLNYIDIEIRREYKNIDILILSESNGLCIMIENKIYAKEGKNQLRKYRDIIENEFNSYKYKIYIYLSLYEQEISERETEYYIKITYSHIKNIIEQILNNQSITIAKNTKFILEQYLQTLKKLMNENDRINEVASELYKKYKSAFDLVFKYASPNRIPNNLKELIEINEKVIPFVSTNRYIRFQPKFLYDYQEELVAKGFIDKSIDLKESWLFLFEFVITKSIINFDIKIGEYSNEECRLRLYNLFKKHKDTFHDLMKNRDELSHTWHLALRKKIITEAEYYSRLETDNDNPEKYIEKKFREVIDVNLKKVEEILLEALNE